MKRTIFKMGNRFRIISSTNNSNFVIDVDAAAWTRKKEWEFTFRSVNDTAQPDAAGGYGTEIYVTELHEEVMRAFSSAAFSDQLIEKLETNHQQQLEHGLEIKVNGRPLQFRPVELRQSERLKSGRQEFVLEGHQPKFAVRLFAGIGESNPAAAGWYVFCNERLILRADQTKETGWGETKNIKIPKYHNQFAEFRGYAYFECEGASALPWNTTKTGLDGGSSNYAQIRPYMISLMRTVIDFLNKKDKEKDEPDRELHEAVEMAGFLPIDAIPVREGFGYLALK